MAPAISEERRGVAIFPAVVVEHFGRSIGVGRGDARALPHAPAIPIRQLIREADFARAGAEGFEVILRDARVVKLVFGGDPAHVGNGSEVAVCGVGVRGAAAKGVGDVRDHAVRGAA